MGCHGSKQKNEEENTSKKKFWLSLLARIRRNNKVVPLNVPDTLGEAVVKVGSQIIPLSPEPDSLTPATDIDVGTPMLFLPRKSEDAIRQQLKEEGFLLDIKMTGGGIAFTVKLEDDDQTSKPKNKMSIPELPKYSKEESALMSQIVAEERLVKKLPRLLPPIQKVSKDIVEGYTPEERRIMAEVWRNNDLQSKGEMARVSMERKEMAAERREKKEKEKKAKVEKKMLQSVQKKEGHQVTTDDKLKRAKMKREKIQLDLKVRTEQKLSKSRGQIKNTKATTEEKVERARQNRENLDAARRERWLQKEQKMEAARIRKEESKKKLEETSHSALDPEECKNLVMDAENGKSAEE